MGLMDRVKQQAAIAAQKAQEAAQQAAQQGKDRLDQAQANRRAEALLRQLGAAVYADRTGRGGADSQAKIERLVTDLQTHEQANGLNLDQSQSSFGQQPGGQGNPQNPSGPFGGGGPGPGTTPFTDPSGGSGFPGADSPGGQDAGPTTFPDTSPRFYPGSHDEPDSGQS
jgi:hypothetical protein